MASTVERATSTLAAVALVSIGLVLPAEARADDGGGAYDVPAAQALVWPLPHGMTLVIRGPDNVWQLRTFAERLDAALPGVEVVSGLSVPPPEAFVLTVVKEYHASGEFAGFTDWDEPAAPGAYPCAATVTLNTYFRESPRSTRRQVAAHELMHVLGFRHHQGAGVVGAEPQHGLDPSPSVEEWAALHAYYR